jgi:ATP-dependent Clp protease ATP-binding subunit ClpB
MEKWNNSMPEAEEQELRIEVFSTLRHFMRPEFLNRVDEIVMFKPLTLSQTKEIINLQIATLTGNLLSQGISLVITEKAVNWLADHGYDPQLGARPVKRLIQKEIINMLSKEIISGSLMREDKIILDIENDRISFRNTKKRLAE